MKDKKRKTGQGEDSSRRRFIKGAASGLVASAAVSGLSPVALALQARDTAQREKERIECTVGRAVRMLMDPEVKEPPDLAAIYRSMGGKAEFTVRLLAETFGSRSMKTEGIYPLRPATAPDLHEMTRALEKKAIELVSRKVPGVGGKPVENTAEAPRATPANVVWVFESSPKFKASCQVEANV